MPDLTYPEVGATGGALPPGYRHLRYRTCLGPVPLQRAGEAILSWEMHRAAGARIPASAARAARGATVVNSLGVGPLRVSAPCRVVDVVVSPERIGLTYGTLPGHPARGEEAFEVDLACDGLTWFTVTAFSTPARWYLRAAGPIGAAAAAGVRVAVRPRPARPVDRLAVGRR